MTSIPRPKLFTRQGDTQLAERELASGADLTLGRGDDADLRIDHRSVSEAHARIVEVDGRVYVEDLGSLHGTFVSGKRVERRLRLRHGQTILLGQHDTLGPVMLHFEDRASALLDRLGVPDDENVLPFRGDDAERTGSMCRPPGASDGDGSGAQALERVASPAAADARSETEARSGDAASSGDGSSSRDAASSGGSESGDDTGSRLPALAALAERLPDAVQASSWAGRSTLVFLAVVALGFGWLIVEALRPSSVAWRAVQLTPQMPLAGGSVTLESPDIDPWDEVDVRIDGRVVDIVEQVDGRLTLQVPRLPERAGGDHLVRMVVSRDGDPLLERRVSVLVRPLPERLVPARVAVGQPFAIEGTGLGGGDEAVRVWVDGREVEVTRREPDRIEAMTPDLEVKRARTAQVEVGVGEWRLPVSEALWLQPRVVEVVDFDLQAIWDAGRKLWRLNHPFGGGFWIGGAAPETAAEAEAVAEVAPAAAADPSTGTDTGTGTDTDTDTDTGAPLPQGVVNVIENWRGLFAAAAVDPSLRVEVEAGRKHLSLVARGEDDETRPLVTWPRRRLAQWQEIDRDPLMEELYCYTMAREINDLLEVFARGRELPSDGDGGSVARPYVPTLNRLVNLSRLTGRDGRPEWRHVEKLSGDEQVELAGLLMPGPERLTPLGGRWDVMLENVFFPDGEYRVEMALELENSGRRLGGEARVALKSDTMALGVEPVSIQGRLKTGERPEIVIEVEFDRPIGKLVLVGELDGRVIDGSFVDQASGREARWRAVRAAHDAPPASRERGWATVG